MEKLTKLFVILLTLLLISLLLINLKPPTVAQSDDPIYLHGPSLTPIHMQGPRLTPIHMHSLFGIIDLTTPLGTPWHELYPNYCENWTFTSWEDNGNGILDSSDQIDMTNDITQEVRWYHVDRVTMTMGVWSEDFQEFIYVEYKGPYDPYIQPICTLWHEVWPVYNGVTGSPYHIINWTDNGNGYLDVCDYIEFEAWPGIWWHVEEYATDLILNEKLMDPIGIEWHELYPSFSNWHTTTSWEESIEDVFPGRLSPGDQLDMINQTSGITKWYYVDRVTFTMRVSNESDPAQEMYIEYKGPFETMYNIKTSVINSTWHEVYPLYSMSMNITGWTDNCNGVLDYCDMIELSELQTDIYLGWWHVEELTIDIILNEKIADPISIIWHELYPECGVNDYETLSWEDNGDGLLNPCDNVTLALLSTGLTEKYHIENMTITLNLTVEDVAGSIPFTVGERIYIEYLYAIYYGWEWLYYPKTHPLYTDWEVVCPTDRFGYPLTIESWLDNCNGVLSYCDMLELLSQDGGIWCHIDDVAIDITVKKITEEPPPPSWYMKYSYPDYAISGMPDFDQRQWGTYNWTDSAGRWSHCGPVAVANSLWWLDSEFEPNTIPPPTIIDNYPLVQAYGSWDDHDRQNVAPLVEHLAYFMDTDGIRTGIAKLGTNVFDMQAGITHYLSWSGVNPLGDVDGDGNVTDNDRIIVEAAMGTTPGTSGWDIRADIWPVTTGYPPMADNIIDQSDLDLVLMNMGVTGQFYEHTVMAPPWEIIVDEVLRCQDVVLLIAPWYFDGQEWYRYDEAAHFVTVAGLNASTWEIVLSDPINDNAEAGGTGDVPIPHSHSPPEPPYITHNNASLVSHDMYLVIEEPCPGGPLALVGYPGSIANPPDTVWQIEAAVITSPYVTVAPDIAVTDLLVCYNQTHLAQNRIHHINVTVTNQGPTNETFTLVLYWNSTNGINVTTVSLLVNETKTVTITWDATQPRYQHYELSAIVTPLPGETDTTDNTYVGLTVTIVYSGDVDADKDIDIYDVVKITGVYDSKYPDPQYSPNSDIDCNGHINIYDVVLCTANYGYVEP